MIAADAILWRLEYSVSVMLHAFRGRELDSSVHHPFL